MTHKLIIFLKGILMGIAETIPGISGATIALFLGVYEKLISSLNAWMPHNLYKIFKASKYKKRNQIRKLNFSFLFFLILGMAFSIFTFSHLLSYLFENFKNLLLIFFVGFILTSTVISGHRYFNKNNKYYILLGIIMGLSLNLLTPANLLGEKPLDIIITGFITVIFGLLPGVSGSFMMLIIGKYEFILNVVKTLDIINIIYFLFGVFLGIMSFIRGIKFLLDNYNIQLLSFFFSFVIASTSSLIKQISTDFNPNNTLILVAYLIVGILAGIFLHKMIQKNEREEPVKYKY
jgi:putative membrane protein